MLKTVTEQKPTKATNAILFPSKTSLSMYDDFKTRKKIKKKKQKNGADHHIVSDTAESRQKRQMSHCFHRNQTFLCTMITKCRKKEKKKQKSRADYQIACETAESWQKRHMSHHFHQKQTFLCTTVWKRREKIKRRRNKSRTFLSSHIRKRSCDICNIDA